MLVIGNVDITQEGEWMDITIWGGTIRVKVRPRTAEIVKSIRDRFKDMKEGKKKEETIIDAMYDHFVEDFEEFGVENADKTITRYEVNVENKKKLLFIPVPMGEQTIYERVYNKSVELGFKVVEEEQKN